ncbi:31330_t:CDS:1, partial [Racocetra persica]
MDMHIYSLIKTYIDESIHSSTTSVIQFIKQYINSQFNSQLNKQRLWNEQLQANITNVLFEMKQINSENSVPMQKKGSTTDDHTASSQQPQQPTDINWLSEKKRKTAQLTNKYPPTPVLNELIMRVSEVMFQDQDIVTT